MERKIDRQIRNDSLYSSCCDSNDEAYKQDKENMSDDMVKWVDEMHKSAEPYLDDNFSQRFSKEYNSRYLELVVANHILNSPYRDNLIPKDKQGIKKKPTPSSIDFKVTLPNQLSHELVIECACPNFGEIIIPDNEDFKYSENIIDFDDGPYKFLSYTEAGENWQVMSRFTSCIKEKVEKQFKNCIKDGTIEKKSYKILCISGTTLIREETKRRGVKVRSLHKQFINAVKGLSYINFFNDGSTPRFENDSYSIKKTDKTFIDSEEIKEYLNFLDGIIYFEDTIFNRNSPTFVNLNVTKGIKEIIYNIFPAD